MIDYSSLYLTPEQNKSYSAYRYTIRCPYRKFKPALEKFVCGYMGSRGLDGGSLICHEAMPDACPIDQQEIDL